MSEKSAVSYLKWSYPRLSETQVSVSMICTNKMSVPSGYDTPLARLKGEGLYSA